MNKETTAMKLEMRQGDVGLVRVGSLPKGCKQQETKRGQSIVLAYGEVTGHAHAIRAPGAASLYAHDDGRRYLRVRKKLELRHEEHGPVRILPGLYEVRIQREYTPQAVRNVLD